LFYGNFEFFLLDRSQAGTFGCLHGESLPRNSFTKDIFLSAMGEFFDRIRNEGRYLLHCCRFLVLCFQWF
jgi:hypothetical protein